MEKQNFYVSLSCLESSDLSSFKIRFKRLGILLEFIMPIWKCSLGSIYKVVRNKFKSS